MIERRAETSMPGAKRTGALASLALVLAIALIASPPAGAGAETRYRVTGAGLGHGVGLSQWGAYGFAKHGRAYRDIATHYFKGSKIGKVKARRAIRVLLDTTSGSVSFSHSDRACGRNLKPSSTYRAALGGSGVRLESSSGRRLAGCGKTLDAKGVADPIRIGGQGSYRGDLLATAAGGTLYIVNEVGVDDYVQGVVPNEMPSSWPLAALQAQAVAARSYALATNAGSGVFDQYDDTRSQVYGGLSTEAAKTNRAVRRSHRQVLTYNGKVIPGFYSSSSGGRTENVEFAFPGATPEPYLKSVQDPFDDASPDHRWRLTLSRSEMQSKLGDLVKGRFRGIKVTKRGVSPRIVKAKVLGSGGATTVTGSDLQGRLGLRSTWAKFKRLR
jgi:stage II sporulation protein D